MFEGKQTGKKSSMSTETVLNTISQGTVLVGNITTKGDIRIEGKILGTVVCGSKLVIGENGVVEGNIDAKNANIAGEVKGTVVVRELLQLQEKGKIQGDIYTLRLAVQVGAFFSGHCSMGEDARATLSRPPEKIEEVIRKDESGSVRNFTAGRVNL